MPVSRHAPDVIHRTLQLAVEAESEGVDLPLPRGNWLVGLPLFLLSDPIAGFLSREERVDCSLISPLINFMNLKLFKLIYE